VIIEEEGATVSSRDQEAGDLQRRPKMSKKPKRPTHHHTFLASFF
jgi:hypothetical protein